MAENTKIEWVDHTFNPWIGCTRIIGGPEGSACDNCYAASMSHRRGWARFEAGAPRKRTTAAYWRQPLLWNKKAAAAGRRAKVFGPSLADPYDAEIGDEWRNDYMDVIEACPWLDFILLTKRPQVALKFHQHRKVPDNLWPGITAENQKMLELRAPVILQIPARVHVLSAEPVLGPLDLEHVAVPDREAGKYAGHGHTFNALQGQGDLTLFSAPHQFGWVIAGGESGPKARPSHPDWFRSLRRQCRDAEVPFFFKQWGEWTPGENVKRTAGTVRTATWFGGTWSFDREDLATNDGHVDDQPDLYRVGKKAAGAELDGIEHRASPQ